MVPMFAPMALGPEETFVTRTFADRMVAIVTIMGPRGILVPIPYPLSPLLKLMKY